jgi:hypothetical protein
MPDGKLTNTERITLLGHWAGVPPEEMLLAPSPMLRSMADPEKAPLPSGPTPAPPGLVVPAAIIKVHAFS